MGLSWSLTIPAGASTTVSHLTLFSPLGTLPLTTAKTVNPGSITAGDAVSYTITVTNPNTAAVDLSTLVDTLPAGFSYVPGSSSGATTSDPSVAGQNLTWNGPLSVAANGSLSLSFSAQSDSTLAAGTYYNRVQGTATGYTVQDSGDTAPVVVTAGGTPPGALTTAKTVSPSSAAPGDTVSYTITVTNPNATAVALDTLVDTLPNGLSYVAGSSSGATTTDPGITGQVLTWNGPLNVMANGSLSLSFNVQIDANLTPGTLYNNVSGTASGYTVQPSGNTAALTVRNNSRAAPQLVPTLSQWGVLSMGLIMALLALYQIKSGRRL